MSNNICLSLKEKVGQLFMIGFYGTELSDEVKKFINTNNIGFIILFSRNIESINQVIHLTNQIHNQAKISPFLYTDQEGGTVVQFGEIAATVVSHMGISATGNVKNAKIAGSIIGEEMNSCGIDGVLAPVLDVNIEENNPIIGIRSFSDDPEIVINYARNFFIGLNRGGVAACGKHYPGHGNTLKDSHVELPVSQIDEKHFMEFSLKPFFEMAKDKIDSIMSAHISYPNITKKIATFSPYLINDLLRKRTGYNGVILTDCLEMRAIKDNFSPENIVQSSLNAGIDVLTISHSFDFQKELFEILIFLVKKGIVTERRIDESISRILYLKNRFNLIKKRKVKDINIARRKARSHKIEEEKIANQSVTLLRNNKGIIPVNKEEKFLIVEWKKVKATIPVSKAETFSMLGGIAKRFLKNVEIKILGFNEDISDDLRSKLLECKYIIAGIYSRNSEVEKIQSDSLKRIAELRNDIIVVALGNPYDIKNIPFQETYIVTYGFRRVQIEALFRLITGQIKPSGKIPVDIKNVCLRGFGLI